jgi:hypothetical protein
VFVGVLTLALVYEWRKGVLDWSVPLGAHPEDAARRSLLEEGGGPVGDKHGS